MKKISLISFLLLFSTFSKSDTLLGVYINAQQWFYDYSGDLSSDDFGQFDLENDLKFGNETAASLSVAIEHPAPLVPNFKLRYNEFSNNAVDQTNSIATKINLNHTDLTLYYELLDNWLNLDLGLSVMYFDGSASISNPLQNFNKDDTFLLPALYAKAQFEFPITNLSANVTLNIAGLSDSKAMDLEVSALYEIGLGFGLEAGYRRKTLEFDKFGSINIDTNGSGLFAGVQYHF